MKLRECKIGLPVRVKSVYHSHPLEGFIYRIGKLELPQNSWDDTIKVVYVMLTTGDHITMRSLSRLNPIQRNGHETT